MVLTPFGGGQDFEAPSVEIPPSTWLAPIVRPNQVWMFDRR